MQNVLINMMKADHLSSSKKTGQKFLNLKVQISTTHFVVLASVADQESFFSDFHCRSEKRPLSHAQVASNAWCAWLGYSDPQSMVSKPK